MTEKPKLRLESDPRHKRFLMGLKSLDGLIKAIEQVIAVMHSLPNTHSTMDGSQKTLAALRAYLSGSWIETYRAVHDVIERHKQLVTQTRQAVEKVAKHHQGDTPHPLSQFWDAAMLDSSLSLVQTNDPHSMHRPGEPYELNNQESHIQSTIQLLIEQRAMLQEKISILDAVMPSFQINPQESIEETMRTMADLIKPIGRSTHSEVEYRRMLEILIQSAKTIPNRQYAVGSMLESTIKAALIAEIPYSSLPQIPAVHTKVHAQILETGTKTTKTFRSFWLWFFRELSTQESLTDPNIQSMVAEITRLSSGWDRKRNDIPLLTQIALLALKLEDGRSGIDILALWQSLRSFPHTGYNTLATALLEVAERDNVFYPRTTSDLLRLLASDEGMEYSPKRVSVPSVIEQLYGHFHDPHELFADQIKKSLPEMLAELGKCRTEVSSLPLDSINLQPHDLGIDVEIISIQYSSGPILGSPDKKDCCIETLIHFRQQMGDDPKHIHYYPVCFFAFFFYDTDGNEKVVIQLAQSHNVDDEEMGIVATQLLTLIFRHVILLHKMVVPPLESPAQRAEKEEKKRQRQEKKQVKSSPIEPLIDEVRAYSVETSVSKYRPARLILDDPGILKSLDHPIQKAVHTFIADYASDPHVRQRVTSTVLQATEYQGSLRFSNLPGLLNGYRIIYEYDETTQVGHIRAVKSRGQIYKNR